MGLDLLDPPEPRAEARKGGEEPAQDAIGDRLVPAAERRPHPLADLPTAPIGLDDLEILVGLATLNTTLEAEEHGCSIFLSRHASRFNRDVSVDFRH